MNLLIGIGNDLLADDGVGCLIAEKWKDPDWTSVVAGTVPENFIRTIREVHPDVLLFADAAQMNLPPGSIRIIPLDRIADAGIGTHQLPLDALCGIIAQYCGEIIIIGIQPEVVAIGEEMSRAVMKAGDTVLSLLNDSSYIHLPVFDR